MHPQSPVPRVPTNEPTSKPTNRPSFKTMIKPTSKPISAPTIKPTNLLADSSKREHLQKQRAAQLCNAATPTGTTPSIRTWSQVATAAAQVAPPSLSTHSWTGQSGVPLPSRWPGFAVAVMWQQRHQLGLVCLTHRITWLENEVHQAMAVMDKDTGKLLNCRQLMSSPKYRKAWSESSANKFGWLPNGIGGQIENPTNTMEFIFQHKVPSECMKDVTYSQFVCTVRLEQADQSNVIHSGRRQNQLPQQSSHPDHRNAGGQNALQQCDLHKGCVLHDNRHLDISNFYLMTPLHCPEFIWIKLSHIYNEVVEEYKLKERATKNGSIYIKAKYGMYGLSKAGLLANKLLKKIIIKHGYQ